MGEKGRHAISVARLSGGRHCSLQDENNVTYARNISISGVRFQGKREGACAFFFDALIAKNFRVRDVVYEGELRQDYRSQPDSEEVLFENVTQQ